MTKTDKESLLLALALNAEPRSPTHEHIDMDSEDDSTEETEQPAYWVEEWKLEHQYHNL